MKSGTGSTFHVEIYRSGYYGGAGARLFSVIQGVPGVLQQACNKDNATGLIDCSNWSTSLTLTTTASWPTGVYMIRIVRDDTNSDNQILLTVRDDSSHAQVLYGVGYSTFQAYNNYGGKSLYDTNSFGNTTVAGTARAVKVSYDRPFEQPRSGQRDWYTTDGYPTVYWLESQGYDVAYISNTDLELHGNWVLNHSAYISPGHDEYYSAAMRTALEQGRDAGTGLFFSGSNEVYWKVRFEDSPYAGGLNRVQVCYKTTQSGPADPSGIPTTTWRDPNGANKPENALAGEMYTGDSDNTFFPLVVSADQGSDRLFRYTGLDSQIPGTSTTIGHTLVGWEWDARYNNGFEPAGVKTLASSPVTGNLIQNNGANGIPGSTNQMMTKYVAASGALVFATGTNYWVRGLALDANGLGEPDSRIQQITVNALEDMGAKPQTPSSDIVLDVPDTGRPPAPTPVSATGAGTDSISLSWGAGGRSTGLQRLPVVVAAQRWPAARLPGDGAARHDDVLHRHRARLVVEVLLRRHGDRRRRAVAAFGRGDRHDGRRGRPADPHQHRRSRLHVLDGCLVARGHLLHGRQSQGGVDADLRNDGPGTLPGRAVGSVQLCDPGRERGLRRPLPLRRALLRNFPAGWPGQPRLRHGHRQHAGEPGPAEHRHLQRCRAECGLHADGQRA